MLLALDIGNSNIKTGIWNNDGWKLKRREETWPVQDTPWYQDMIEQMIEQANIHKSAIKTIVLGSVVPDVSKLVTKVLTDLFDTEPIVVDATLDTGIQLAADAPDRVGADLVAGAAAAYNLIDDTCIIVDLGTATTVMVVQSPGVFEGGAICNGLKMSVKSLVGSTAQLQDIPLEMPPSPIGKNTIEAMQSGLVGGHLHMIEGLISKMREETGPAQVVATGGLVSVIAPHTDMFDYVEPTLVLDGLRLIAERQR